MPRNRSAACRARATLRRASVRRSARGAHCPSLRSLWSNVRHTDSRYPTGGRLETYSRPATRTIPRSTCGEAQGGDSIRSARAARSGSRANRGPGRPPHGPTPSTRLGEPVHVGLRRAHARGGLGPRLAEEFVRVAGGDLKQPGRCAGAASSAGAVLLCGQRPPTDWCDPTILARANATRFATTASPYTTHTVPYSHSTTRTQRVTRRCLRRPHAGTLQFQSLPCRDRGHRLGPARHAVPTPSRCWPGPFCWTPALTQPLSRWTAPEVHTTGAPHRSPIRPPHRTRSHVPDPRDAAPRRTPPSTIERSRCGNMTHGHVSASLPVGM